MGSFPARRRSARRGPGRGFLPALVWGDRRRRAEEELHDAQTRYRSLVEQLPLVTYIESLDPRESTTFVSPQIATMLGYSIREWESDPDLLRRVVHADDRAAVLEQARRSRATGEPRASVYRMVARNGRIVWVQDQAVTVRDRAGWPMYTQGFLVDVTARKEAEERRRASDERSRLLVDTALDAVVTMDADGVITGWNAEAERTFGWPRDEALGRALVETVIPPGLRAAHAAGLGRFLSTGEERVLNRRIEVPALHREGHEFPIELAIVPIEREGGLEFSAFIRDITARKQAEAERERLLELERAQNERLRELDRLKDEFVALVSHELRTPLTSICGYLEVLLDEDGVDPDEREHFLRIVDRNAKRLHRLVGDLLFVAQVEAGRLTLERGDCDLLQIAHECVEAAGPMAEQKEIALSLATEPLPTLDGDRSRLAQLLDNLVANAVKFTPAGGSVELRIGHVDGRALIEVADTGIGIPSDQQSRLFERFFRASSATEQAIPGTGLGLAIARAIVSAHGGEIAVESVEGAGTTFSVLLPFRAAGAEGVRAAA